MILKNRDHLPTEINFSIFRTYVFALHATIKEQIKNFEKMVLLYSNP